MDNLIWAVIVVGSVAFTASYAIVSLNSWLDRRDAARRNHAHPKRRFGR